jgi:phage FluMu protein Com
MNNRAKQSPILIHPGRRCSGQEFVEVSVLNGTHRTPVEVCGLVTFAAAAGPVGGGTIYIALGVALAIVAIIAYLAYRQYHRIKEMDRKIETLEDEIKERKDNPEFKTRCPKCRKVLTIPEADADSIKMRCPKCGSVVKVANPRAVKASKKKDEKKKKKKPAKDGLGKDAGKKDKKALATREK